MFFHSTDWGFDMDYQKKKEKSRKFLSSLELSVLNSFSCSYFELVGNDSVIDSSEVYLVTVDSNINSVLRHGYFNISSVSILREKILSDFGTDSDVLETCRCHFIEQLFLCPNCFTGALFSNCKGDLICEVICGTIDNRELTSGSSQNYDRKQIIYSEGNLITCDDYVLWSKLLPAIKVCIKCKGYFEFSFGRVGNNCDIYFSYYSDNECYQNVFFNEQRVTSDMFASRCVERCYLQYIGDIP